jgi:peptidoglycan/xylan/chitin deacetylase (PgdA/CDA1 family)
MYHYVRDARGTPFPGIKGESLQDFARQVDAIARTHELATLESALAFLNGTYAPRRDMCLLTFDDGLKDHYANVLPVLARHGAQGLFFLVTGCIEEQRVAAVHKNHFLLASVDFPEYASAFRDRLRELSPETDTSVDAEAVSRTYRWDTPEVAAFKYLINFRLSPELRDQVLDSLFVRYLGDEKEFSRDLYISWEEGKTMQAGGMLLGGHTHNHLPLARMDDERRTADLTACAGLLRRHLSGQALWPFSYPYGKKDSFNPATVQTLRNLDFSCAFATEVGTGAPGDDIFAIKRIDPKDVAA